MVRIETSSFLRSVILVVCLMGCSAVLARGGRGGPFIDYHGKSLSSFDAAIGGNPLVIGGTGFGFASKKFRFGGAGGGGFLMNGTENVQFGMGYGGLVGEYLITKWLYARLLMGGGGYSVTKITSQTPSQINQERIGGGGFFLFHPSVNAEIKLNRQTFLDVSIGYFLPNVQKLTSFTIGFNLVLGG